MATKVCQHMDGKYIIRYITHNTTLESGASTSRGTPHVMRWLQPNYKRGSWREPGEAYIISPINKLRSTLPTCADNLGWIIDNWSGCSVITHEKFLTDQQHTYAFNSHRVETLTIIQSFRQLLTIPCKITPSWKWNELTTRISCSRQRAWEIIGEC